MYLSNKGLSTFSFAWISGYSLIYVPISPYQREIKREIRCVNKEKLSLIGRRKIRFSSFVTASKDKWVINILGPIMNDDIYDLRLHFNIFFWPQISFLYKVFPAWDWELGAGQCSTIRDFFKRINYALWSLVTSSLTKGICKKQEDSDMSSLYLVVSTCPPPLSVDRLDWQIAIPNVVI